MRLAECTRMSRTRRSIFPFFPPTDLQRHFYYIRRQNFNLDDVRPDDKEINFCQRYHCALRESHPITRPSIRNLCRTTRTSVKSSRGPFTSDVLVSILIAPTTFRDTLPAVSASGVSGNHAIAMATGHPESRFC